MHTDVYHIPLNSSSLNPRIKAHHNNTDDEESGTGKSRMGMGHRDTTLVFSRFPVSSVLLAAERSTFN